MQPLTFEPIIKRIRWGGTRLGSVLGKSIGDAGDYAESWELADHGDDQTIVSSGPFAETTLAELVKRHNGDLFGSQSGMTQFPLLIKFLDANDWLSLQVHPNDQQAKTYDPSENGKTEAWVIIDAEPGSEICVGLKESVTKDEFRQHVEAGTVEETLHKFEVKKGDCVFVPAGTVHAIGSGVLLAEVQQQSDLTFRIHDWGRMGSDGKPRQIHIEEALECIDFTRGPVNPVEPQPNAAGGEELVRGDYFLIDRYATASVFELPAQEQFRILMLLQGDALVGIGSDEEKMKLGSTLLVPANHSDIRIQPTTESVVLDISVPCVAG